MQQPPPPCSESSTPTPPHLLWCKWSKDPEGPSSGSNPPTPAAGFECALGSPAVASPQTTPRRPAWQETLPSAHRNALQKAFLGLDLITPAALHPLCPWFPYHSPTLNHTPQEGKPLGRLVPWVHLKTAARLGGVEGEASGGPSCNLGSQVPAHGGPLSGY